MGPKWNGPGRLSPGAAGALSELEYRFQTERVLIFLI